MEVILEVLFEGFLEIMFAIIPKPENGMTKKKEEWLKFFVALYTVTLLICIFIGIILHGEGSDAWYYFVFIPVGLIVINIILNVIIKTVRHKKGK